MTSADELRTLLGDDPPESVQALDAETLANLAEVIAEARRQQARSLAAAYEAMLKQLPFPVRGIVKRVLG